MWQDVRFALRSLARSPGFTSVAVLTLAVGIGATTAIFTLVDAVLLRPLDVGSPERLVALQSRDKSTAFLYNQYQSIRAAMGQTIALAIEYPNDVIIDTEAGRIRRRGAFVSANYFDVLQRRPLKGRSFVEADDATGAAPVVVISDAFWRASLGSDPEVVGRVLRVSGVPMTIVGVAPPRVRGTDVQSPSDIFLPAHAILRTHTLPGNPGNYFFEDGTPGWSPGAWWRVFGRVASNLSLDDAQKAAVCPACKASTLQLIPIQAAAVASRVKGDVSRFTLILVVAVVMVLLIGCANVAGLVLARTESKRRDIAVRLAMGSSRARVIRQLFWECAFLSAGAAAVGTVLGRWMLAGLARFELPGLIPLGKIEFPLDARLMVFAGGTSLLCAAAFGLAPARAAAGAEIVDSLKHGGRGGRAGRSRYLLIGAQVALTMVLVFGAALFMRSLRAALNVDIGIDASRVIIADTDIAAARFEPVRRAAYFDAAVNRLAALPGIEAASYGTGPFFLSGNSTPEVIVDGVRVRLPQNVAEFVAGPEYFRALGMPLLAGRDFIASDDQSAPAVVVVNAAFARRLFPGGQSPLGHRIGLPPFVKDAAIIGVVEDAKYARLDEPTRLAVFAAWKQGSSGRAGLIARTAGSASLGVGSVREAAVGIDREVPVPSVRPLSELVSRGLLPQQLGLWLLGSFGIAAMLLGMVGIHALVAFLVAQRTHEIGVRLALGARPTDVIAVIVRGVAVAVLCGAVAGGIGAWWLGAVVSRLLFGITPHDSVAFVATLAVITIAGVAGCVIPTRRAAAVDPMIALRSE